MNPSFLSASKVLLLVLSGFTFVQGATVDFDLIPSGRDLQAVPGETVGWGYSLANNSAGQWLVPTALNGEPFLYGQPIPLFDFPVLSPGASVSVDFDASQLTGLYAVAIAAGAQVPFVESGMFTLSGEWWSGDPAGGGVPLADSMAVSVPWSVQITADVPEPEYWLPCILTLPALYGIRRKRLLSIREDR